MCSDRYTKDFRRPSGRPVCLRVDRVANRSTHRPTALRNAENNHDRVLRRLLPLPSVSISISSPITVLIRFLLITGFPIHEWLRSTTVGPGVFHYYIYYYATALGTLVVAINYHTHWHDIAK
ncbi:hypothetical protein EDC01DRAFT_270984 [Geopyxis carbonaria]|nr:hypothetical protein EDC01DRAFT_270984 [Geopyxis carbonaria]